MSARLTERFSLAEKILMSTGFYGIIVFGVYGIYSESPFWGTLYLVFVILGILILFGYCLCSHCPYPYKHSDCLFQPFGALVKRIYKFRPGPMDARDKIGFIALVAGLVIIPQYWLLKDSSLLVVFWALALPTFAGFSLYECRRCEHLSCPFNTARKKPD